MHVYICIYIYIYIHVHTVCETQVGGVPHRHPADLSRARRGHRDAVPKLYIVLLVYIYIYIYYVLMY